MRLTDLFALSGAIIRGAKSACSSSLLIDDFSNFAANTNSLGSWTSDDGSMSSISASNGVLAITPKTDGYFYESFDCQAASSNGYSGVSFSVKGPAGGSFTLELQTRTSCAAATYGSKYFTVSGLSGNTQVVTVPWSSFAGANANAITAVSWSAFSSNAAGWELSKVNFACGGGSAPSSAAPSVKASSARAASSVAAVGSSAAPPFSVRSSSAQVSSVRPASSSVAASSIVRSSSKAASSSVVSSSRQISSVVASSSVRPVSSTLSTVASSAQPASSGCSKNLVVEDFTSQSRLTFLFYNALGLPTSDDGTLTSITVDSTKNRAEFKQSSTDNYWYTKTNCLDTTNKYGGASMRIKAAAGTTLSVSVEYVKTCGGAPTAVSLTSAQLGWTFDNTDRLYSFKFSQFAGLDASKVDSIILSAISKTVVVGPISLYCGNTASEYIPAAQSAAQAPTSTVAAPAGTASAFVIDKFANKDSNALGSWHGADDGMTTTYSGGTLKIVANDPDLSFYTQFVNGCFDLRAYEGNYLHIKYSGSTAFSIAIQQHNTACNTNIAPYPQTWDEVEAGRYASNGDIYVPLSHFKINKQYAIGIALKSWYTSDATTFSLVEIVKSIPSGVSVKDKLPTGNLVFACTRPNSFAFCIDDGDPALAQQVMEIIKSENIKVTFFTVGAPLLDSSNNLSAVYKDMQAQGHQLALHSYTHPKMEGLPNYNAIDWEYNQDVAVMGQVFNGFTSKYFRPPFGTEGARMRYRWTQAAGTPDANIVNWSVDIEDWIWATSSTPQNQLTAFKRDVDKGGNLVVAHYLYPSTVQYLRQFIQYAKGTGKQLMRLDQCMQDPNAPPL